jgi:hypothetical protein
MQGICDETTCNLTYNPRSQITRKVLLADSGASDTFVRNSDTHVLVDQSTNGGAQVRLPNGAIITSTGTGTLRSDHGIPIPAHVFPDSVLQQSLVSLADFTNRGCEVVMTAHGITITKNGAIIMEGTKHPSAKLWYLQPPSPLNGSDKVTKMCANHIVTHQINAERVAY